MASMNIENTWLHPQNQIFLITPFLSLHAKGRQILVDLGVEQKQFPPERGDTSDPVVSKTVEDHSHPPTGQKGWDSSLPWDFK